MRAIDIKIGEILGVKNNPYYFKVDKVLGPKEEENTNGYIVVRGWFSTTKNNFNFALRKYFKPVNLYRIEGNTPHS